MESYKLSMQTCVVLFSSMLDLCEKIFDGWLSYIYIHKRRCRGVDGTRPTHGMELFCGNSQTTKAIGCVRRKLRLWFLTGFSYVTVHV